MTGNVGGQRSNGRPWLAPSGGPQLGPNSGQLFPARGDALTPSTLPTTVVDGGRMLAPFQPNPSLNMARVSALSVGLGSSSSATAAAHLPHLLSPYLYSHHLHSPSFAHTAFPFLSHPQLLADSNAYAMGTNVPRRYLPAQHSPPSRSMQPPSGRNIGPALERTMSESEAMVQRLTRPSSPRFLAPHPIPQNRHSSAAAVAGTVVRVPGTRPNSMTTETRRMSPRDSVTWTSPPGTSLPALEWGADRATQPYYPSHFMKGTTIQLANGELRRVEDMTTENFFQSADMTVGLRIDSSTVVRIQEKSKDVVVLSFSVGQQRIQVSVEATVEHPFYVIGQGWSSCNPSRTLLVYGLNCHKLQVGDVCVSLTHREQPTTTCASSSPPTNAARDSAPLVDGECSGHHDKSRNNSADSDSIIDVSSIPDAVCATPERSPLAEKGPSTEHLQPGPSCSYETATRSSLLLRSQSPPVSVLCCFKDKESTAPALPNRKRRWSQT